MGALTWLKKVNDFLERVPNGIDAYFRGLSKSAGNLTQSEVDVICARVSWYTSVNVEKVRQKVIGSLHDQYESYTKQLGPVSAIAKLLTDPLGALGAVVSAVKTILNVLVAPYKVLIQFSLDLIQEIARLAENLAKIASYVPPSINPRVKFDKFKVKVNSISLGDVVKGPDGLPAPEVMFPEPSPIFSKETFQKSFDEARTSLVETKKKYSLDENESLWAYLKGDDNRLAEDDSDITNA